MGIQAFQTSCTKGLSVCHVRVNDLHSPLLDGLHTVTLLNCKASVPDRAGIFNRGTYRGLVQVKHVCGRCASSPEHAHKVDPLACFGANVLYVVGPGEVTGYDHPQYLGGADPLQDLASHGHKWRLWRPSGKDTIVSLVLSALSCISLFSHQTVVSSEMSSHDTPTRLPSHGVVNILRASAVLQQIFYHQGEDDRPYTGSLGHSAIYG